MQRRNFVFALAMAGRLCPDPVTMRMFATKILLSLVLALPALSDVCRGGADDASSSGSRSTTSGGLKADRTVVNPTFGTFPLKIKLPFPAGATYQVIQGNHGTYTHTGFNQYAWDFEMPENSPVCAAAAGRIVRVKQDGTAGGPSEKFFNDGNAIIIDHGDGYFSQYLHLAPGSARVKEGDHVSAGQVIALSGDTGFSSTPHLHFHVQDPSGYTLPVSFQDVEGDGKPAAGTMVTSSNDGTGTSQYAGESYLPPDIFNKNSVMLITRNLPGHLYRSGREYVMKGRLTGREARQVAVYFMTSTGGAPLHTIYARVDRDGFFEAVFDPANLKPKAPDWNKTKEQSNLFSLAIAPVNQDGSFWSDVSVPVCVR